MDIYGKHGNGSIFVKNSSNKPVLPRNGLINTKYEGTLEVFESKHDFNSKSEVNQSDWQDELAPDRPFNETLDAINKDARLNLSVETYIQMILGKGLKVTAKKEENADKVMAWLDDIGFQDTIEDGLYSYLGVGNWMLEPNPSFTEFVEIPIYTIDSIVRNAKGHIKYYKQHVNDKDIKLKEDEVIHFKLTNVGREPFARGMFHSILTDYTDPRTGIVYDAPLIQMKEIEDNIVNIIKGHADPTVMFYFEDAGEQFIKTQADNLKKMKKGSKIVTDKKFEISIVEAKGDSKFQGWIDHMQRDVLEPGSKFPLQFFNAGFTARAASESTDSVLIRKVKRLQERFAGQIKRFIILPYLDKQGMKIKSKDIQVFFETPQKQVETIADITTAFRDNILKRSEARKWFISNTDVDVNQDDMEDLPPITSVTPTDQLQDNREDPEKEIVMKTPDDTEESINLKSQIKEIQFKYKSLERELNASDKRNQTKEIMDLIRSMNNE